MKRMLAIVVAGLLALSLSACEEELVYTQPKPAGGKADAGAAKDAAASAADAAAYVVEFTDHDFVESDDARDPFRNFARLFLRQAESRQTIQRKVRASQYALDELKLTGIITRGSARAMLTDPVGVGWVLRTGDYVGRAELVSAGGPTGADIAMNWRVDRIREKSVVFLREDPAHPEILPATRVVHLHPIEQETTSAMHAAAAP